MQGCVVDDGPDQLVEGARVAVLVEGFHEPVLPRGVADLAFADGAREGAGRGDVSEEDFYEAR